MPDPPKSPLKRGTLSAIWFPLFKGARGIGGVDTHERLQILDMLKH
jgi:hypothetical protein